MVIVELDVLGRLLVQPEFLAGLVPEQMTISRHSGSLDAVHDDATTRIQHGQHFGHDFLQTAAVTANEDGIRTWSVRR